MIKLAQISALSNLGFKASFGNLKIEKLADDFFPLIAFKKTGEAILIASPILDKKISITDPLGGATSQISTTEFKETFSQYFIIVKELNEREKKERSGHWFFSSFRKSKWIYVRVIAAMVSNFLSLSTALFTTVYDKSFPMAPLNFDCVKYWRNISFGFRFRNKKFESQIY